MRNIFFTVLLLGTIAQTGCAQNFDKDKLDQYFDVLATNNKFMGSVAVSKEGQIIYSRSLGYRDVEQKLEANKDSKYRIGSISKTFTTVLVFKAVEAGKLSLDQTIDKYFPDIENSKDITVENLLYHRSGIHNFTDDRPYLTWSKEPKTEQEMVDIITNAGSDFKPDSKSAYSNSNFVLLTFILEKSFEKTFTELLDEHIIEPLGLQFTNYGGKIDVNANQCQSYRYFGDWKLQSETDMSVPLGAGAVVSTPSDLTKFSDVLFGGKLLEPESLKKMKTINGQFGMGLFKIPFGNNMGYGHNGGIDGFSSVFANFSDGNVSYALTSNGTNMNNNDISIAVLSAVFNKPYSMPKFTTYEVSSEDLDKYLGIYASENFPLKITITKDNNTLVAQATGQSSFPLEATKKNVFKFDQAGVVLTFDPQKQSMKLNQGGGEFIFFKE